MNPNASPPGCKRPPIYQTNGPRQGMVPRVSFPTVPGWAMAFLYRQAGRIIRENASEWQRLSCNDRSSTPLRTLARPDRGSAAPHPCRLQVSGQPALDGWTRSDGHHGGMRGRFSQRLRPRLRSGPPGVDGGRRTHLRREPLPQEQFRARALHAPGTGRVHRKVCP